jgi:hypothetical protein
MERKEPINNVTCSGVMESITWYILNCVIRLVG